MDLSGVNKISVAFWLWWDSFSNNDDLALEHSATASNAGTFLIGPDGGSVAADILANGNVGFSYARYTRPSAAAWHHWLAIFDFSLASNEVDLYLDGVLQTPLSRPNNSNNTGNFISATVNVMSRNNTSLFGPGRMAELAIYPGEVLNASEALALARGVSPRLIRPSSLPYYWPLWGVHSPEISLRGGGAAMTVNSATLVNHAPVTPFDLSLWTPAVGDIPAEGQPMMRRWPGVPYLTPGPPVSGRRW